MYNICEIISTKKESKKVSQLDCQITYFLQSCVSLNDTVDFGSWRQSSKGRSE